MSGLEPSKGFLKQDKSEKFLDLVAKSSPKKRDISGEKNVNYSSLSDVVCSTQAENNGNIERTVCCTSKQPLTQVNEREKLTTYIEVIPNWPKKKEALYDDSLGSSLDPNRNTNRFEPSLSADNQNKKTTGSLKSEETKKLLQDV